MVRVKSYFLSKTRYHAKKFNLNFCLSKIKHSRGRIQVWDTDWLEWQDDRKGLHAGLSQFSLLCIPRKG